ncbi:MAG: hypothetical protein R3B06_07915 [Kofleriaceae bacterium]
MRDDAAPDATPLPPARTVAAPARRFGWFVALALLPPGWLFIAHAHRWHVSPSVVVLCLGWTALIGGGYALVRASNAVVEDVSEDWFVVGGSRGELEREKKSLIRAIKEIEFDRDTGKVSAADAQAMIATYRARAIEVIKVLDAPPQASPRDRILAEIQARAKLAKVAAKAQQKAKQQAGKAKGGKGAKADQRAAVSSAAAVGDEAPTVEAATADAPEVDALAVDAPTVASDGAAVEASAPDSAADAPRAERAPASTPSPNRAEAAS